MDTKEADIMKIKDLQKYFNPEQKVISIFLDEDVEEALKQMGVNYDSELLEECCDACHDALSDCTQLEEIVGYYLENIKGAE
jgi:hypothetical protein